MATDTSGSSQVQQWAVTTRQVIGRPRRGPQTRTEQTALPDKQSLAIASRLTKLKGEIDKLKELAPDKAAVTETKYELLKRSLLAGNAVSVETPLAQLESVVAQLLVLSRPKPKPPTSPPPRRPPPLPPQPSKTFATPETATPLPQDGFDEPPPPPDEDDDEVPPPPPPEEPEAPVKPVNPVYLKKLIDTVDRKLSTQFVREGGDPATALKVRLEAIKNDCKEVPKQADCLAKIKVLGPEVDTLATRLDAAAVAAAKLKVGTLAAAPVDKTRADALKRQAELTATVKKGELKNLLKAGSENQDQGIHRDTLLGLSQSKDEQYIKKVKEPCDAALTAVAAALENKSTVVTPVLTKRLQLLLVQLEAQKVHYADKTGITDPAMIKQRDAKVAAIEKRKLAMKACIDKVAEIVKVKSDTENAARAARKLELEADGTMSAVTTLTKNLSAQQATNPEEAKANAKNLLKLLSNADPVTRQTLLSEIGNKPDQLAIIIRSTEGGVADGLLDDIVKVSGSKCPRALADVLIKKEFESATNDANGKASALRSATAAPSLASRFLKADADTQKFLEKAANPGLQRIVDLKEDVETDPKKLIPNFNPDDPASQRKLAGMQKARAKKAEKHKELARQTLDEVAGMAVPDDVAKTCATIYDEAMAKFGDETHALALVGGQMMLRLIAPAIADARTDPTMTPEQQRAINMQSKLLQNMSNGQPPGRKEPDMDIFDDLFVASSGGPSPEVVKMQEFFKRSVKEGKRGKITLRGLLPNATARAAFQEFMVKDSDANTVPFWELTKDGMPGDPQAVFNKYIAETGESQMNLPGPIMAGFTAAKTAGDWTQAPWAEALETVVAATENDNFPRVKKDGPLWTRICAAFNC